MPGCGSKRERDTTNETLASIVAELNQDIRDAQLSDVILVGHSISGVLLPMMVAADRTLFSSLIYISASLPLDGESIYEMMGTKLHGQDTEHVGWPVDVATTPPSEMAQVMFGPGLTSEQFTWLMAEVAKEKMPHAINIEPATREGYNGTIQASYIITLRDPILPVEWQRKFADRAFCKKVLEIDTPHEPFVSHPVLLTKALEQLLTE